MDEYFLNFRPLVFNMVFNIWIKTCHSSAWVAMMTSIHKSKEFFKKILETPLTPICPAKLEFLNSWKFPLQIHMEICWLFFAKNNEFSKNFRATVFKVEGFAFRLWLFTTKARSLPKKRQSPPMAIMQGWAYLSLQCMTRFQMGQGRQDSIPLIQTGIVPTSLHRHRYWASYSLGGWPVLLQSFWY